MLLFIFRFLGFAEDEFVIEEIVQDHSHDGSENEDAGALDEIVIKGKVDGLADIKSEIIERSDEGEDPGEEGTDEDSADGVPDKEFVDAGFAGVAFLPSDS